MQYVWGSRQTDLSGERSAVCNAGDGFAHVGAMQDSMSVLLLFGLTACGSGKGGSTDEAVSDTGNGENTENMESASTESTGGGGKTRVVYHSVSGNTEEVASYIAAATGGELFRSEPVNPYTDEDPHWTDEGSRVCREHENEEERNVGLTSATLPGMGKMLFLTADTTTGA